MKKVFIGLGITIGVLVGGFLIGTVTSQNKAISLEELVSVTSSDIEVQEKRRVDLINNLVDTVKEYDKHEAETLEKVIEKRGKQGSITDATTVISGIAEAYPQLKSEHRKTYNGAVKNYNRYVRRFPARMFLNITGYEKQNFDYLEFNASSDAPTDLFGDKNE